MENMEIRKATEDDFEEVQSLCSKLCEKEHEEFDSTIIEDYPSLDEGEQYLKDTIKEEDRILLVASVDGKTVGYLIGGICEEEFYRSVSKLAEVENMFVLKDYRGSGIGKSLLKEFLDWCRSRDVERIRTIASSQNEQAKGFYREMDFKDYSLTLEKCLDEE